MNAIIIIPVHPFAEGERMPAADWLVRH